MQNLENIQRKVVKRRTGRQFLRTPLEYVLEVSSSDLDGEIFKCGQRISKTVKARK